MTFFSHRPSFSFLICYFSVRGGAKSVADSDTGGPKSLLLAKFTMLSLLFLPRRGANSIANFDGGHGRICPPGSATGGTYPCPLEFWKFCVFCSWCQLNCKHFENYHRTCITFSYYLPRNTLKPKRIPGKGRRGKFYVVLPSPRFLATPLLI